MLVPLSWLRDLVQNLPTDVAPITAALDSLGLVVEGVESSVTFGGEAQPRGTSRTTLPEPTLPGVVVCEVVAIRPHPNADKVRLIDVRTTEAGDPLPQVACGAWNFSVGDRVPLATLGTTLPNGLTIETRKLRGEISNGMLCSAPELGLGADGAGLLILPPDAPLGVPVETALGVRRDAVLDVSIEANRPDAMSMRGVARDLAPRFGTRAEDPADVRLDRLGVPPRNVDTITATDLCDRLTTTVIENVVVTDSPEWIKQRLLAAGMRPINNLVDASNYVMLELGIPSHAFDLDTLGGHRIGVRWAAEGERIVTLDGKERTLSTDGVIDGVIVDGDDAPMGIAAVMGGLHSEVTASTSRVLLEIAHWAPMAVARSSKKLGLRSEASARFERNADREALDAAAVRFIDLIELTCPSLRVVSHDDLGGPSPARVVDLSVQRVNLVLGTALDAAHIEALLKPIGFDVHWTNGDTASVTVPSWRTDVTEQINVIEEVGRHYGYDAIQRVVPLSPRVGRLTQRQQDRRTVRRALTGRGISEAWTTTLIADADVARSGLDDAKVVRLANPLVAEEATLRPGLLPGLLNAIRFNASHRNGAVRLFETGRVFGPPRVRQVVPYERENLGVVLTLPGDDARSAVAVLDALVAALGLIPEAITLRADESLHGMHPTRSAVIVGTGTGFPLGRVGEVNPSVLESFGIAGRVGYLELDLENLCGLARKSPELQPVSSFPSSDLDLAFVTPDSIPADSLVAALRTAAGTLCESVELFDIYRGKGVPEGSRSLAIRLRFIAPDRTLSDAELASLRDSCIATGVAAGGTLRA